MMKSFELPLLFAVFVDMLCAWMLFPDLQMRTHAWGAPGWVTGVVLASFYPAQALTAPMWTKFAAQNGRKWAIIGALTVSALGFLGYMLASSVWILWFSRIVGGIGGATLLLGTSVLSDRADPYDRPAALGRLGAMALAGFVLGPAVGGLLGDTGGNGLLGAAGFFSLLASAVLVGAALPESGSIGDVTDNPMRFSRRLVENIAFRRLVAVAATFWIGFASFEATLGLLMRANFRAGAFALGLVLTFVGLFAALGRLVLNPMLNGFEASARLRFALITLGLTLLLVPSTGSLTRMLVLGAFIGLLWGVSTKGLEELAQERIHPIEALDVPAAIRAAMATAFVAGSIIGGVMFDLARYLPFVVGGIALIAAAASEKILPLPEPEIGVEPPPNGVVMH